MQHGPLNPYYLSRWEDWLNKWEKWTYGFHAGADHGSDSNLTLDFGASNSVDSCSQSHDRVSFGKTACDNDRGFYQCLLRVRPATETEKQALSQALYAFKVLKEMRCVTGTMQGILGTPSIPDIPTIPAVPDIPTIPTIPGTR